ncbi:MAG: phytanoyl-CoA dioxygenase family protein [Actinomycetota bacterium]
MSTTETSRGPVPVRFGSVDVDWPTERLGVLRESTELLDDADALRDRFASDGYLLLRGVIPREVVLAARRHVAGLLAEAGALAPSSDHLDLEIGDPDVDVPLMGHRPVTHHRDVLATLEADELFAVLGRLLGAEVTTFDHKWLRTVSTGRMTGAHMDVVYMGAGSTRLTTTWIPIGDLTPRDGTLAIVPASHRLDGYARLRETYGRVDVDRDNIDGWFTTEPFDVTDEFGGTWATAEFRAGDVVLFGMRTLHASTTNLTTRHRLSCDVRFQPTDDPIDERWMGERPPGHVRHDRPATPVSELRAGWGLDR